MRMSVVLILTLAAIPGCACHRPCGGSPIRVVETPQAGTAPLPMKAADPRTAEGPVIEAPWDHMPQSTRDYLVIGGARPGQLYYRYFVDSDTGVELERASEGKVVWRVHVEPFRMAPGSAYFQKVDVRIEGDRVVVDVLGAAHLVEVRDLATGRQISREFTQG